jgi:rhodanese-related sulfurtransferase
VRVLVADTWKQMDFEIEWGYEPSTAKQDYSGRIEVYDGRLTGLGPLRGDRATRVSAPASWRSAGKSGPRRGVRASLLYLGTSKWRRVQPFTSQPDDVARTIVTVWTRAGNFSFLAGDLENGPILAPEYGFFVRRTSEVASRQAVPSLADLRKARIPLADKMHSIAGNESLLGWGSDQTPWFGGNPTDQPVTARGIAFPARSVAMHPGSDRDVAVGWCSAIQAVVRVQAGVAHAQNGSNGIEWWIARETPLERRTLAHGVTDGAGQIPAEAQARELGEAAVAPGDMISLVVGPKGPHQCDTTIIELVIAEVGGSGRVWNLTRDVVGTLHAGNPHADGQGEANVWHFYSEKPSAPPVIPSEPPIELASQSSSAREFIQGLQRRNLGTIRQHIRAHAEQSWEGAVTAMRGTNLPPHPMPPPGFEPSVQVQVPCPRLTAQWNLGTWHLLRHAQQNPQTGRLWFNDHPYGILGAWPRWTSWGHTRPPKTDSTNGPPCPWIPEARIRPVIIRGPCPTDRTDSSPTGMDA